jgi:uncharacterized protein (DUF1810 family)
LSSDEKNETIPLFKKNFEKTMERLRTGEAWGLRFPLERYLSSPGRENDIEAIRMRQLAFIGCEKTALLRIIPAGGEEGERILSDCKENRDYYLFQFRDNLELSPSQLETLPGKVIYSRRLRGDSRLVFYLGEDKVAIVSDGETGEEWGRVRIEGEISKISLFDDNLFTVTTADGRDEPFLLEWSYKSKEWERNDPSERLKYILDDKLNDADLIKVARFDEDYDNRREAFLRIKELKFSEGVIKDLERSLKELPEESFKKEIAKKASNRGIRLMAAEALTDYPTLLDFAKNGSDPTLRKGAWKKLNLSDGKLLGSFCEKYGIRAKLPDYEDPWEEPLAKPTEIVIAMTNIHDSKYLKDLEELIVTLKDTDLSEDHISSNALMWAAGGPLSNEKLRLLLRLRPEWVREHIGVADDVGRTPLHYLAMGPEDASGSLDLLVSLGADIDRRDYETGRTALHELSMRYGRKEDCISSILAHDPEFYEDIDENSPVYYEWKNGDRDLRIAEYLGKRVRESGKDVLPFVPASKNYKASVDILNKLSVRIGELSRYLYPQDEGRHERLISELKYGGDPRICLPIVFPSLRALSGESQKTRHYYGIKDFREAESYLNHSILGNRLRELAETLLELGPDYLNTIFSEGDKERLRTFLTIFAKADRKGQDGVFSRLMKAFGFSFDPRVLELINRDLEENSRTP